MKTIGIVSYLNTIPLAKYINHYHIIKGVPSELAILFNEGKINGALLPVVTTLQNPNSFIVDNISISCHQESASVLLFINKPIEQLKTIALDQSSQTSTLLLKLLLKKYYKIESQFEVLAPDKIIQTNQQYDAYLLIGDIAIEQRKINSNFLDLGKLWYDWTGLPFVFAVWASKDKNLSLKKELLRSKKIGLENIDQIIDETGYPDKIFLKKYYQFYLHFNLAEKEKKGLELFQKWLYEEKLISTLIQPTYF